jgi:hypothetical protein
VAPTTISRETFETWRAPRFGTQNPTRFDNPLWASLVHDRINAYQVNKRFGYQRQRGAGATWCFDRFGQTATTLDDGRTLYIAGEHEDYYDPDFYIYNDVVVAMPDGTVAIYGYPRAVFPPTDFHSATLDGDRIWIVGSLGYADARKGGTTQVCQLDLGTLAIEQLATAGDPPGWIHKHEAQLVDRAIVVRGGLVEHPSGSSLEENIDEWGLDLATLTWTRRTALDWQRWVARRSDGGRSVVWELRQMKWEADNPRAGAVSYRDTVKTAIGGEPDLSLVEKLYRFDGAVAIDRSGEDFNVWRVEVDGVIVRFTEQDRRVAVIVEGRLAEERLRALQDHVLGCLSALHLTAWELER